MGDKKSKSSAPTCRSDILYLQPLGAQIKFPAYQSLLNLRQGKLKLEELPLRSSSPCSRHTVTSWGRGSMASQTAVHHDAKPQSSEPMKGWIPGAMTQLHSAEESCTLGNGATTSQPGELPLAFGSIADNLSWRCPVGVANVSKGTPCPASSIRQFLHSQPPSCSNSSFWQCGLQSSQRLDVMRVRRHDALRNTKNEVPFATPSK
ncbi:hypothetical protein LZ30DRAFT_342972 [Colletotrichum cereale]|nr:hypothetical protein LZ30DRAFT_342972 [Colletotrichum cereale]